MIGWVIVVIHCLICILVYVLIKVRIFQSPGMIMPLIVLVPVWGLVSFIFLELACNGKLEQKRENGLEKLKVEDKIYKSILKEDDSLQNIIVPLQEALIMNDTVARRALMTDIMYSDISQYVELLKEARMNEDTEVVHYAVTSMVELQNKYDKRFQEIEKRYEKNGDDRFVINEYAELLQDYMESGLLEGNMLTAQKRKFEEILKKKLKTYPNEASSIRKLAQTQLFLGKYAQAEECIQKLLELEPGREDGYLLQLEYLIVCKKREEIAKVLQDIKKYEVHLSAAGYDKVRFWLEEDKDEEKGVRKKKAD